LSGASLSMQIINGTLSSYTKFGCNIIYGIHGLHGFHTQHAAVADYYNAAIVCKVGVQLDGDY